MKKIISLIIGLSLFVIVQDGHAHNKRYYAQPWADWYARTTMNQIQLIHQTHCRHHGDRWQGDYSHHYRWASRHELYQAEHEIHEREERLIECRRSQYQSRYYRENYPQRSYANYQLRYRQSYSIYPGRHTKLGISLVFGH